MREGISPVRYVVGEGLVIGEKIDVCERMQDGPLFFHFFGRNFVWMLGTDAIVAGLGPNAAAADFQACPGDDLEYMDMQRRRGPSDSKAAARQAAVQRVSMRASQRKMQHALAAGQPLASREQLAARGLDGFVSPSEASALLGDVSDDRRGVTRRAAESMRRYGGFVARGTSELATTGHLRDDGRGEGRCSMFFFSVLMPVLLGTFGVCYAFALSTGWLAVSVVTCGIIISGLTRMRMGKKRDVLPSWIVRSLSFFWFLAALSQVVLSSWELSRSAGWIADFSNDLIFASVCALLLLYLQWLECLGCHSTQGKLTQEQLEAMLEGTTCASAIMPFRDGQSCAQSCSRFTVRCGCWLLFFLCGLPSLILASLSLYHSGKALRYMAIASPSDVACSASNAICLSYKCEGEVREGAIAIVVPGFSATRDSYFYLGRGLQSFTRTCTYDPRGQGWSTWPNRERFGEEFSFGFAADAADVATILEQEFARAGIAQEERVAVIAGHSRGNLVGLKFQVDYSDEYRKIVVIGFDGVDHCGAVESSFEDDVKQTVGVEFPTGFVRYALSPFMTFVSGAIDISIDLAPTAFFAGDARADTLPSELLVLLPETQQAGFQNQFTMERFWEANAIVRQQWERRYDGPTFEQCAARGLPMDTKEVEDMSKEMAREAATATVAAATEADSAAALSLDAATSTAHGLAARRHLQARVEPIQVNVRSDTYFNIFASTVCYICRMDVGTNNETIPSNETTCVKQPYAWPQAPAPPQPFQPLPTSPPPAPPAAPPPSPDSPPSPFSPSPSMPPLPYSPPKPSLPPPSSPLLPPPPPPPPHDTSHGSLSPWRRFLATADALSPSGSVPTTAPFSVLPEDEPHQAANAETPRETKAIAAAAGGSWLDVGAAAERQVSLQQQIYPDRLAPVQPAEIGEALDEVKVGLMLSGDLVPVTAPGTYYRYCSEHSSLVQLEPFAKLATSHAVEYLRAHVQ